MNVQFTKLSGSAEKARRCPVDLLVKAGIGLRAFRL